MTTASYIPLYRKYRPQSFSDLVGQDIVVKTLSNAVNLNKVAHAYLFTGSRGTGKTSAARILAKSLNCVEGPTVNPCGKCPSCIDITNSNSVDVIEIDAASNRNVEDARNLIDKVHFMPVAGKYKIYIIDEVHMLTSAAFNTLLKTLEEPPKNLVFILATTELHKVLTTIISRCQRFDFKRVNQDLISQRLKDIAQKENIIINDKAVSIISRRCHGGVRDALGLLDQISVLSSLTEEISESDIISLMGSMSEDTLFKMADTLANKDINSLIMLIDEISEVNEPVQVIRELINYFRNLLFAKTTDNLNDIKDIVDVTLNLLPALKAQSNKFESNEIVEIIEKLTSCERNIKNSSQQLLWLEVGLIGICHRQDIHVLKELESRILRLEEVLVSGNIPVVSSISAKPVIKPVEIVKQEIVNQVSENIVEAISSVTLEKEALGVIDVVSEVVLPQPASNKDNIISESNTGSEKEPEKEVVSLDNLADSWKELIKNIDGNPTQSFFMSVSKPVEINSEKIIVTIKSEIWLKKFKEDKEKNAKLEQAAEKMFGKMPRIIVRTPLPEDFSAQKKNEELRQENTKTFPAEKIQQITSSLVEDVTSFPKRGDQVVVDETPYSELDKEISDELEEIKTEIKPVNLSDQAKLILDLFNGKIIEE